MSQPQVDSTVTPKAVSEPRWRKNVADGIIFETVARLLTLGHQALAQERQIRQDPVLSKDPSPEAMALRGAPPLPSPPMAQHKRPLATGITTKGKDQEINKWAATATDEQWDALFTKMATHWSHLPLHLPEHIDAAAHRTAYRAQPPRSDILAAFFYVQNVWLITVLALAEKAKSTTGAMGRNDDTTTATTTQERTTIYQQLAARMEGSAELVALCEKVVTMEATAAEIDRLYTYLPAPELSEPGRVAEQEQAEKAVDNDAAKVASEAAEAGEEERAQQSEQEEEEEEGVSDEMWSLINFDGDP